MDFEDQVKAFGMTNMLLESDIEAIENKYDVELINHPRRTAASEIEQAYFPQFESSLRDEASQMARSYELFYCLEKTIRKQIADMLESRHGDGWWATPIIPQHIVGEVKKRIQRERESGITPRSSDELDYTNFGELGEIIKTNWPLFASGHTKGQAPCSQSLTRFSAFAHRTQRDRHLVVNKTHKGTGTL